MFSLLHKGPNIRWPGSSPPLDADVRPMFHDLAQHWPVRPSVGVRSTRLKQQLVDGTRMDESRQSASQSQAPPCLSVSGGKILHQLT